MGTAVESHSDFVICDSDIGWHIDQIAEDLACLGIIISTHAASHQPIKTRGYHEECHVEVDLEADR